MSASANEPVSVAAVASRCSDCAFTKGTEANLYQWTQIKAQLCLITGEPFACHIKGDEHSRPLCEGFREALSNQPEQPEWRKKVAAAFSQMQALAEEGQSVYVLAHFAEVFEMLMQERV